MKKFLLATSALVSATLVASAASAETPKVTVGGFIDFQAGYSDYDAILGAGGVEEQFGFRNDTELRISVDGVSDAGLGYGAVIELEADVVDDRYGEGTNADKTFVYLQGNWGRVEGGSNFGVTKTMKVDASTFARATGGIDGDFFFFNDSDVAGGNNAFIISPDLRLDGGIAARGDAEDAIKLTYYSPRFSGFQLGVSYIPDTGDQRSAFGTSGNSNNNAEHVIQAGVNYTGEFSGVTVAAAATGEVGDVELAGVNEDLAGYNLGVSLGYQGFTVGGSYASQEESLRASGSDADFWTLGAAYETGPFGVSVTYLNSQVDTAGADNEFQNVVLGADYTLAPGLVPYVEVSFFEYDGGVGGINSDGTVVLVGTELTF